MHDLSPTNSAPGLRTLLISETFQSRQGEGILTGTDSFFIRTSGCNLRCWFCDTPYASWNPSGDVQSIDSIVEALQGSGCDHVVLTGGEPLLPAACEPLCDALMSAGFHLTIETAGTIDKPIPCDLLSLSPKLSGSAPNAVEHPKWSALHEQRRMPIDIMIRLIDSAKAFQVKFVVGDASQWGEINQVVAELGVQRQHVYIMPQGVSNDDLDQAAVWLKPLTDSSGYTYCDRMQIRWYGNRRGT